MRPQRQPPGAHSLCWEERPYIVTTTFWVTFTMPFLLGVPVLCDFSWGDMIKCLLTPDRAPKRPKELFQSRLAMSLWGLHRGVWGTPRQLQTAPMVWSESLFSPVVIRHCLYDLQDKPYDSVSFKLGLYVVSSCPLEVLTGRFNFE